MTGMPPPTAASKASAAPCVSASGASSRPWAAIIALLAVTTGRPRDKRRARRGVGRPVRAADHFDEHVDFAGRGERRRIVEERRLLQAGAAFAPAEGADRDDGDVASRARGQVVSPPLHEARQGPADGAHAREADP